MGASGLPRQAILNLFLLDLVLKLTTIGDTSITQGNGTFFSFIDIFIHFYQINLHTNIHTKYLSDLLNSMLAWVLERREYCFFQLMQIVAQLFA